MGRFGPIPKSALVANCLENLQGQNGRRGPIDEKSELAQQSQNLSQQDVEDELSRLKMENRVLMEQLMEMGIMQTTASLAQSAQSMLPSAPLPLEFKSVKEREKERREKVRQLQREGKRKMEDITDWFDGDNFSVKIAKQEVQNTETDQQTKKVKETGNQENIIEDNDNNIEHVKPEKLDQDIVGESVEGEEQQKQDAIGSQNAEIKKDEPNISYEVNEVQNIDKSDDVDKSGGENNNRGKIIEEKESKEDVKEESTVKQEDVKKESIVDKQDIKKEESKEVVVGQQDKKTEEKKETVVEQKDKPKNNNFVIKKNSSSFFPIKVKPFTFVPKPKKEQPEEIVVSPPEVADEKPIQNALSKVDKKAEQPQGTVIVSSAVPPPPTCPPLSSQTEYKIDEDDNGDYEIPMPKKVAPAPAVAAVVAAPPPLPPPFVDYQKQGNVNRGYGQGQRQQQPLPAPPPPPLPPPSSSEQEYRIDDVDDEEDKSLVYRFQQSTSVTQSRQLPPPPPPPPPPPMFPPPPFWSSQGGPRPPPFPPMHPLSPGFQRPTHNMSIPPYGPPPPFPSPGLMPRGLIPGNVRPPESSFVRTNQQ